MKSNPPDDLGDKHGSAGDAPDELLNKDAALSRSTPLIRPRPGDGYLRIRREELGGFRHAGRGHLVATENAGEASGGPPALVRRLRIFLTGRTLV